MTLGEIQKEALQVFGIPNLASAPQVALDQVLVAINATLQRMRTDAGEALFTEEHEVTLVAGTQEYTLPKNIITMLEPAKLSDGTLLRQLTSRGQLFQFGQIFQDQLSGTVASGKPSAYYVETGRDTADVTGDNVVLTLHVLPSPTAGWAIAVTLLLDVVREPTLIAAGFLTTAVLQLPHKYSESIFLPLLRKELSRSYLFFDKNKLPGIEADYERALGELGGKKAA